MALETWSHPAHGWPLGQDSRHPAVAARMAGSIRYGGVLCVWLGLLLIRPRLALGIFRHRRTDSPIPRLGTLFRAA